MSVKLNTLSSFNSKFEAKGGQPILERKSIAKLIQIKESLGICDV